VVNNTTAGTLPLGQRAKALASAYNKVAINMGFKG
jgi:hypothetical protein